MSICINGIASCWVLFAQPILYLICLFAIVCKKTSLPAMPSIGRIRLAFFPTNVCQTLPNPFAHERFAKQTQMIFALRRMESASSKLHF